MILGSRSMVSRCRGVILGGRWVVSLSFVGDISDKAIVSIGVVLDMLDTSIRKVDRVRSFHVAGSVTCLASAEHRLGVVVGHRVVVCVGRDLVRIGRLGVVGGLCWGMVGRCRGMVGRGSFDYRSVVCRSRFVVHWGGMDSRDYTGVHCPVGLVHGVADGRRLALLDHLQLMGLVKWHSKDSARESA